MLQKLLWIRNQVLTLTHHCFTTSVKCEHLSNINKIIWHCRPLKVSLNVLCVFVSVCCGKSFQLNPTLCQPMDCCPPGSSVHGILQARILEWLPCLSPWDIPNPGIKSASPVLPGGFFITSTTWEYSLIERHILC